MSIDGVAQVLGADGVLRPGRGGGGGCRIWPIILFRLQGSHLFVWFDVFLSSGGPENRECQSGFIYAAKQNKARFGGEKLGFGPARVGPSPSEATGQRVYLSGRYVHGDKKRVG